MRCLGDCGTRAADGAEVDYGCIKEGHLTGGGFILYRPGWKKVSILLPKTQELLDF
jgi:hypothetical protein